ncbi:MAG: hypothetical protein OKBPIBMD_01728 [Chlorobi bacterium]|nr:MAG: hypothetical protein UZ06_CHB003000039 [Chlorobi bacterium OLB6]MBV6464274.1 hypothetical protein [Chlorobiota bacterium]
MRYSKQFRIAAMTSPICSLRRFCIAIMAILPLLSEPTSGTVVDSSNALLSEVLRDKELTTVVQDYGIDQTISFLLSYTQSDTIDDKRIWYIEYLHDSLVAIQGTQYYETPVASLELKALYWLWLIYRDEIGQEEQKSYLIDTTNHLCLYDYAQSKNQKFRLQEISTKHEMPVHYTRKENALLEEIRVHLREWFVRQTRYGLAYMRSMDEPPLSRIFVFMPYHNCY